MNGYKILKCFRKEQRVSGELPCPTTGLSLKYFTITIGAISKTTSVLKLSQDPPAKNIKCQIKIKIKIFSI